MEERKHRVLCVDDSQDLAEMLVRLIGREPDFETVGVRHSADGLAETAKEARADVALLDLTMPGEDPLAVLKEMTAAGATCRVVVFSGYDDDATVAAALDAGAWGFVSKNQEPRAIVAALRTVARGGVAFPETGRAGL